MQEEKYTKFKNEIWKDRNIKGNEKLVLLYLISYNNEALGYSFPTRKQIQDDTGISKDTLGKTLKSLIDKGYITKKVYKSNTGRNNIYYIHKYLVASKKASNRKIQGLEEAPQDAQVNEVVVENGREQSTNELLVIEKAKVKRKLNANDKEYLNGLNTDILIKAIERANEFKPNGYHIGYIASCYESIEKELQEERRQATEPKTSNNSNSDNKSNTKANTKDFYNNNYPVKTKYHNSFNEHFRNYTEDELEAKLLKMQNSRN